MNRAKLRELRRNAAVVLGSVGTAADAALLTHALDDAEPPVREHRARSGPVPSCPSHPLPQPARSSTGAAPAARGTDDVAPGARASR
jgi:hypothetical protein